MTTAEYDNYDRERFINGLTFRAWENWPDKDIYFIANAIESKAVELCDMFKLWDPTAIKTQTEYRFADAARRAIAAHLLYDVPLMTLAVFHRYSQIRRFCSLRDMFHRYAVLSEGGFDLNLSIDEGRALEHRTAFSELYFQEEVLIMRRSLC